MKAFLKKSSNLLWKSSAQLILVALIIFFGIECKGSFFTVNNLISITRRWGSSVNTLKQSCPFHESIPKLSCI